MRVLVTGATGYLGQFVVKSLAEHGHDVVLALHSRALELAELQMLGARGAAPVDLRTGQGLDRCLDQLSNLEGPKFFEAVVNCAAMSVPRDCEADRETAFAVNVPNALLSWMSEMPHGERQALLIHLSTDQVYEGVKSYYREDDELRPVNVYGESKVAAERVITSRWKNYAILRSSIIVGPEPPIPIRKTLPVQWIDNVLGAGQCTSFFEDEFRNPVSVFDVANVVCTLLTAAAKEDLLMQRVLNVGGPMRLSRADMATAVARLRGYNLDLIQRVPASSMNRGVPSPADISMDLSHLLSTLHVKLTPFEEAVAQALDIRKR